MSKKSRRPKGRSKKWSRANIMAFAATAVIALSMVIGSALSFSNPQPSQVQPTAPIVATETAPPPVTQVNPTPTAGASPTSAPATPTP